MLHLAPAHVRLLSALKINFLRGRVAPEKFFKLLHAFVDMTAQETLQLSAFWGICVRLALSIHCDLTLQIQAYITSFSTTPAELSLPLLLLLSSSNY